LKHLPPIDGKSALLICPIHARLGKELDKTAKDMAAISWRLNNPGLVTKAP
jgi:hypothetical protein